MKSKSKGKLFVCCMMLALCCAACGGEKAASMHLLRTEGNVDVQDGEGRSLTAAEQMGLYHGYQMGTRIASYAWIELDKAKLAKMDQSSEIEIQKEGRDLTIQLHEGSVFFQVAQPLEEDETMQIRTSTMAVGIRGTCGWVSTYGSSAVVGILEGKVECTSANGRTVEVEAGQKAVLTADGEFTVSPLTEEEIPAFILDEADLLPDGVLETETEQETPVSQEGGSMAQGNDGETPAGPDDGIPPELDDGIERTVIEVSTTQEMVALRNMDLSNTEIHLTADVYELGDRIFSVYDAQNLLIIGGPSTRISGGKNGGGSIFFARNCENLVLYQVEFGNNTDGEVNECVSLYHCDGVKLDSCVFYSGMRGIQGDASSAEMCNCEIRGCVTGGLSWRNGSLALEKCIFRNNGENSASYDDSPMFQLTEAALQMTECELYDNTCINYSGTERKRDVYGNYAWVIDESTITETGTISEGNLW